MEGYLVLNTIVGGQTLAEVSDHLSPTLGIVIIAVISLIVSMFPINPYHSYRNKDPYYQITFCGCQVLHWQVQVTFMKKIKR